MSLPLAHEYHYELGRLLYDRAEYTNALNHLDKALNLFIENKMYERYVDCLNYVLRILVEQENFKRIQAEKERLHDLVIRENLELGSRTHYILGLCSFFREGQEEVAHEYFQKALDIALQKENNNDLCYALFGLANCYQHEGNIERAVKELQNLDVFFGALKIPDLQIGSMYLYGLIYRNQQEYDRALDYFWKAFELLKHHHSMILHYLTLYGLGTTYHRSGNQLLARVYLQLAARNINEKELPRTTRLIRNALRDLGQYTDTEDYDLIVDFANKSVVERKLGKIDFKNQFILIELLHLFVKNPGRIFPKEILVKKIWNQEYDPRVHDNKIYVTIKRLRQLIEPDINKPQYVFRSKNGYYLNKTAKVLVDH